VSSRKTRAPAQELKSAPDELPIQSAAHLAVHLLPWCDVNEAVQLAYGVYDACRECAEHRSIVQLVKNNSDPSNLVSFRKAVSTITGRKDPDYASKLYVEFFREVVLPLWEKIKDPPPDSAPSTTPPDKDNAVQKFVAAQRAKGISKVQVILFQTLFALTKPHRRKTPKSKRKWGTLDLNSSSGA
jgi:hypothetical protein